MTNFDREPKTSPSTEWKSRFSGSDASQRKVRQEFFTGFLCSAISLQAKSQDIFSISSYPKVILGNLVDFGFKTNINKKSIYKMTPDEAFQTLMEYIETTYTELSTLGKPLNSNELFIVTNYKKMKIRDRLSEHFSPKNAEHRSPKK